MDGATLALYTICLSSGVAALGFGARAMWDGVMQVNERQRQRRLSHVEFLLSDFYVPIYFTLRREQSIWDHVVRHRRGEMVHLLPKLDEANLQSHLTVQALITSNIARAAPRSDLLAALNTYDEHVTLFKALRDSDSQDFPRSLGFPFPDNLMDLLATRIKELEVERDTLHGFCGSCGNTLSSRWGCCLLKSCCCSRCTGDFCVPTIVTHLDPPAVEVNDVV